MFRILCNLLVSAAVGLAASSALAAARAVVTNGELTRIDLRETGGDFSSGGPLLTLQPGEEAVFRFEWTATVSDDGLPVVWDGIPLGAGLLRSPVACAPINLSVCGFQPNGFEQAKAFVDMFSRSGRVGDASRIEVEITGDARAVISTVPDSFADTVTRSGVVDIRVRNTSDIFDNQVAFSTLAGGWVIAAPIPEPATVALMLAGLGLLAVRGRRRGSR